MSKAFIIYSGKEAIIKEFKRELEYYKNISDKVENKNSELQSETIKIEKYFERIQTEFDEYKIGHPENVSIENSKTYEYKAEV